MSGKGDEGCRIFGTLPAIRHEVVHKFHVISVISVVSTRKGPKLAQRIIDTFDDARGADYVLS